MRIHIKMISGASRALFFLRNNPYAIDEEVYQDLSDYIKTEKIKDEIVVRGMIASASKAIKLKRYTNATERQILKEVVGDIPQIAMEIEDN